MAAAAPVKYWGQQARCHTVLELQTTSAGQPHLSRLKPALASKVRTKLSLLHASSCTAPEGPSRISRPLVMPFSASVRRCLHAGAQELVRSQHAGAQELVRSQRNGCACRAGQFLQGLRATSRQLA